MERVEYTSYWVEWLPYPFDLLQVVQQLSPNHLNAHWLPVIFSPPNVCPSIGSVIWGVIVQFQAREGSRSTEEGMGQKSGPRVRTRTRVKPPRYVLTTRGVRHRSGFGGGEVPRETFQPTPPLPLRTNSWENSYISGRRPMVRARHSSRPCGCGK